MSHRKLSTISDVELSEVRQFALLQLSEVRQFALLQLREARRFALLPIHEFLRDNALDLSSPLTPDTLSNDALLSELRRTFQRLVTNSLVKADFALVKDAMLSTDTQDHDNVVVAG
jgi:hypothetical protein